MSQFNLQRQLEHAQDQRRLAAGLHATGAPLPAPADEDAPSRAEAPSEFDALIIDLRDPSSVLTYNLHPEPEPEPEAGGPAAAASDLVLPSRPATALPVWQGSSPAESPENTMVVAADAAAVNAGRFRASATRPARTTPEAVTATRMPTKDRCPNCEGKVRLDRWDLDAAVAHISCVDCGFRYLAKSPRL